MLIQIVKEQLNNVLKVEYSEFASRDFAVSFIENSVFGHVSSNIAMVLAKDLKKSPVILAEEVVAILLSSSNKNIFAKVEVANPGFINFTFSQEFILTNLKLIDADLIRKNIKESDILGLNEKTVLVEYTDPNPFKVFHIGHLMNNIIGEAMACIYELSGANVKRINYQGDVGRHIAINIYAILKPENLEFFNNLKNDNTLNIKSKVDWLGEKYAEGYRDFNSGENNIEHEVARINKLIYEKSDDLINEIYNIGREWSLQYFEVLYATLGTKFDKYIFESEAAPIGIKLVECNLNKVFEIGEEGAVIYDGEKEGLHKRVFINKNGLPTYEAKDLGNMEIKLELFGHVSKSLVITGNEQNDYFKVLYKAIEKIRPELQNCLSHFGHGMMRFADGKMSSRKGNIIAGDSLIEEVESNLKDKFTNSHIESLEERNFVLQKAAIASIKYAVLKQAVGRDISFDMDKVISVEGDSGPYLQYTYARMNAVGNNQGNLNLVELTDLNKNLIWTLLKSEDILGEVVKELAPQKLLTYLIELSREANAWYANNRVNGNEANETLAFKVKDILGLGLKVLAIHAPEKM